MTDPLHTEPRVEVMPEDYDRSHDAWVRLAQEYGVGNLVPPWFDQAFARHRTAAEAAFCAREARLREALVDVGASLAAAISLLERGGKAAKKAAPSDRMFEQMVRDYAASLDRARVALTASEGEK